MYERQRQYERRKSAEAADVGEIPAVVDPERRESCKRDLFRFLTTYFPQSTGLKPLSEDHRRAISRLQECVLEGGQFVEAMFRGSAKTTIGENSTIWAAIYGHRRFVPIFGGDSSAAEGSIDSLKLELSENDLLYADFPEVCHPIRALENKPQRCASQTHVPGQVAGFVPADDAVPQLTHIAWTADTIVLPTIILPDGLSPSSGGIITAHGLLSASRGMKHKRPDGTQQRPDLVFLDDPQTDESARSPGQVVKRLAVIKKNILRLGGHGRKIAVFMAATVIERDDLVDQLLDPKRNPSWQGERIPMVRKWAGGLPAYGAPKEWKGPDTHERLWLGDYARLRNTYDPDRLGDQQRAHREATAFYRDNRVLMDDGAEVAWSHCFDPAVEESAIQHAYNILIDDGAEVFASECQNHPERPKVEGEVEGIATAVQIAAKVNNHPREMVDAGNSHVVAFIDPKDKLFFWMVCAFGDGFTGQVLSYGAWPDQGRAYFTARDARKSIASVVKGGGLEANIYGGLDRLTSFLLDREWKRSDGTVLRAEKCLIDAHWGDITDTVRLFCRQSPWASILLPSHGVYVGAKTRSFNEYKAMPGERRGLNWRIRSAKSGTRQVSFDSNFWKSTVHQRISTPMGAAGCLTLNGTDPKNEHKMLADHLLSETPTRVEAKGRVVTEWTENRLKDNDLLDCLVGCHVAANIQGVSLMDKPAVRRPAVKIADLQKNRKVWKAKG